MVNIFLVEIFFQKFFDISFFRKHIGVHIYKNHKSTER